MRRVAQHLRRLLVELAGGLGAHLRGDLVGQLLEGLDDLPTTLGADDLNCVTVTGTDLPTALDAAGTAVADTPWLWDGRL